MITIFLLTLTMILYILSGIVSSALLIILITMPTAENEAEDESEIRTWGDKIKTLDKAENKN